MDRAFVSFQNMEDEGTEYGFVGANFVRGRGGSENMKQIAGRFSVSYQVVQKLKYQWRAWVFEYVDWLLAPTLRPGDILIMDNLSSHKNSVALGKIQAAGAEVRFLPPIFTRPEPD